MKRHSDPGGAKDPMALLVYGGAQIFGDRVDGTFRSQAVVVDSINSSLGSGE